MQILRVNFYEPLRHYGTAPVDTRRQFMQISWQKSE